MQYLFASYQAANQFGVCIPNSAYSACSRWPLMAIALITYGVYQYNIEWSISICWSQYEAITMGQQTLLPNIDTFIYPSPNPSPTIPIIEFTVFDLKTHFYYLPKSNQTTNCTNISILAISFHNRPSLGTEMALKLESVNMGRMNLNRLPPVEWHWSPIRVWHHLNMPFA